MHFVVTNDDGVQAPGLLALAQEIRKLGKVTVVAPDKNWSASGHVKTLNRPLRVKEVLLADNSEALACDGAPSDCVALPLLGLLDEPVDFVVSGINPNANVGHDVTYSGTVTAAMEGAISNIPSIAISLDAPEFFNGPLNYQPAAQVARLVAQKILENKMPGNVLLNINVPYLSFDDLKGFLITRQGLRVYRDELIRREDPRGRPYYWIGGEAPTGVPEEGTDIGALNGGYVSVSPISLDLTAYNCLDHFRSWDIAK